jgi:hypothetical protein
MRRQTRNLAWVIPFPFPESGFMKRIKSNRLPTVRTSGAEAGQVLRGAGPNNMGLRLLVSQTQRRGNDGAITGCFVILDVGENRHAQSLAVLQHRSTDASEVLAVIRRSQPACVSVVNANILSLEPETTPECEPGTERQTHAAEVSAG